MKKITTKRYACSECGHIKMIATNHYGPCVSYGHYNICEQCPPYKKYPEFGGHTKWICQEVEPIQLLTQEN